MKKYTEEDIVTLEDREHVILRPEMYVGNVSKETRSMHLYDDDGKIYFDKVSSVPALLKIIEEVVANAIDEAHKGRCDRISVKISPDRKTVTVKDNGAGIPVGDHPEENIPTPEVVFTRLRSGSNFYNDETATLGLFGVGVSLTTFLCEHLKVRIFRDGKLYTQHFRNGAKKKTPPEITDSNRKNTFTEVEFTPDFDHFETDSINVDLVRKLLQDYAFCFPFITFGLKVGSAKQKTLQSCRKIKDYMKKVVGGAEGKPFVCYEKKDVRVGVTYKRKEFGERSQISFVNGARTWRGGTHHRVLMDFLKNHLRDKLKKDSGLDVKPRDVEKNLFTVLEMTIPEPNFEGQAKEKLANKVDEIEDIMSPVLTQKLVDKIAGCEPIKEHVLRRCRERLERKKRRNLKSKERKKRKKTVKRLVPCSTTKREKATLYIVEGLSALSNGVYVRDPKVQAIYPLKGKPINAYKATRKKTLRNKELSGLLSVTGLSLLDDGVEKEPYSDETVIVSDPEDEKYEIPKNSRIKVRLDGKNVWILASEFDKEKHELVPK